MAAPGSRRGGPRVSARWLDYFLSRKFSTFWAERMAEIDATVCVITGIGFDPRCRTALERILSVSPPKRVSVLGLRLRTPYDSIEPVQATNGFAEQNFRAIADSSASVIAVADILLQDENRFPTGGRSALNLVASNLNCLGTFSHVVVDISGLPRSIFYPMISFLCSRSEKGLIRNLHVAVSESVELDDKIHLSEFGDADYIHTFRLVGNKKLVWLPVIASRERDRILKIFNQLKDECLEICPILPFPATPFRKPDEVLIDNNDVLFQELAVTPSNLLLCDETNPFDIYRKIIDLHDYYVDKLSVLVGDVTTVVSPLSTKLLSLGALLAAIDRNLPVSYVEAGLYRLEANAIQLYETMSLEPTEIWLTGEPYRIETT